MRILAVPVAVLSLLAGAIPAGAETKIFIIENHRDSYGVDQCLASGANCGKAPASVYCQSRKYEQATSFRRADPEEITGSSAGVEASCRNGLCGEYVAIACTR
jgi:hypothetical protein